MAKPRRTEVTIQALIIELLYTRPEMPISTVGLEYHIEDVNRPMSIAVKTLSTEKIIERHPARNPNHIYWRLTQKGLERAERATLLRPALQAALERYTGMCPLEEALLRDVASGEDALLIAPLVERYKVTREEMMDIIARLQQRGLAFGTVDGRFIQVTPLGETMGRRLIEQKRPVITKDTELLDFGPRATAARAQQIVTEMGIV